MLFNRMVQYMIFIADKTVQFYYECFIYDTRFVIDCLFHFHHT